MSKLGTTIEEIQAKIRAIPGIAQAPDYPDEKPGKYPIVICFPYSGEHTQNTPEDMKSLHDLVIQFHYPKSSTGLARAIEHSVRFSESIPVALFAMIEDGDFSQADTFESISYRFVGNDWADEETVGFEFTMRKMKIRTVIT